MRICPDATGTTSPADPAHFEGPVWRTDFIDPGSDGELSALRFSYGPGARSGWHIHTHEQALLVLEGRGLVSWEGLDEPREVGPGDWVHVTPGVPHWHGAAPSSIFVHAAVTAGGEIIWLGRVDG